MTTVGSHLLDLPCLLLSKLGIRLFTSEKISLRCTVLFLIQFIVVIMSMVILKDFRSVNPDIWITTVAGSQVGVFILVKTYQSHKNQHIYYHTYIHILEQHQNICDTYPKKEIL